MRVHLAVDIHTLDSWPCVLLGNGLIIILPLFALLAFLCRFSLINSFGFLYHLLFCLWIPHISNLDISWEGLGKVVSRNSLLHFMNDRAIVTHLAARSRCAENDTNAADKQK